MFIQFPAQLTEEELALKQKYEKLRKKRKMLQQLNAPKQEEQIAQPIKPKPDSGIDPKELAKKLLKSGKIQVIKPTDNKDRQDGFKRSKSHERKRCTGTDKPGGYLPFHLTDDNQAIIENENRPISETLLYRNPHLVAREEAFKEKKRDGKANYVIRDNPQQGNTIYVNGENIDANSLRLGFASFGTVLNIFTDPTKNCGFITYDSIDAANMAIDEMNGTMLNGTRLKVSLARRQPNPERSKNADLSESLSAPEAWSAIASNFADNVEKDIKKRKIVCYDDDITFEID